jgi:hypothetical protein
MNTIGYNEYLYECLLVIRSPKLAINQPVKPRSITTKTEMMLLLLHKLLY